MNTGGSAAPPDVKKRTFDFAVEIVLLCKELDVQPGVSRTLGRQLLRAGTSIGANVEEAQAGQSRADFINKYSIALKEARETHFWLRLLAATRVVSESRVQALLKECDEIMRVIGAIVVSTKRGSHLVSLLSLFLLPFSFLLAKCVAVSPYSNSW
jgi:four helix bundle protein